jgi:hypothetical protein
MTRKPKPTPEEQAAYDDMRASPGILLDTQGNVIFDGEGMLIGECRRMPLQPPDARRQSGWFERQSGWMTRGSAGGWA